MISIKVDGYKAVEQTLKAVPGKARRAAVVALTKTAKDVQAEEVKEIKNSFDDPVKYTLGSIGVESATKTKPVATVFIKTPPRMDVTYLAPQVLGGARRQKGFEHAVGIGQLVPTKYAKRTKHGNITPNQAKQIVRGAKGRELVIIAKRRGKLHAGVYERVAVRGKGFGAKARRTMDQTRVHQKGRRRGRYSSVVRARLLKPVALQGRTGRPVDPQFDFLGVAHRIARQRFARHYWRTFDQYMKG